MPGDASKPPSYRLGEGDFSDSACNGNKQVCVMYYPNATRIKTWWVDLYHALEVEEAEKQKSKEEKAAKGNQEEEEAEVARMEPLRSPTQPTNQTEQHNENNLSAQFSRLNINSGTPTTQLLWLLSAAIVI
ncbi:hypothetical protein, unlikely [Trypanosoma congolense IL3000]|uniref:Variant surface glycoprotein n=1 Tax=Trypanosoma congolense (strain IL3000) TaxID=1068625 RepID=F9WGD7_TRYCI|nr:hypothetical protein, unlikely [Trypanosoma congolense IL3000]